MNFAIAVSAKLCARAKMWFALRSLAADIPCQSGLSPTKLNDEAVFPNFECASVIRGLYLNSRLQLSHMDGGRGSTESD